MTTSSNVIELILQVRNTGGAQINSFSADIRRLVAAQERMQRELRTSIRNIDDLGTHSGSASRRVGRLGTSVGGLGVSFGAAMPLIAGALAAFAGGAAIVQRTEEIRELANGADRLGTSMQNLSAAQYAAFQGGNVMPQDLLGGLDDLNERMQDFSRNGAGEAVDLFERFNLEIEELAGMNAVDQLLTISDALEGISGNERAQILDQLGSDSLRQLAPMLKNGSDEFRRLMKEAVKTGAAVNDIDARKIEQLGKDAGKTSSILKTKFDAALGAISPAISNLIGKFNTWLGSTSEMSPTIKKVGGVVIQAFGFMTNALRPFHVGILFVKSIALGLAAGIGEAFIAVGGNIINFFGGMTEKIRIMLVNVLSQMASVSDTAAKLAKSLQKQDWKFNVDSAGKVVNKLKEAALGTADEIKAVMAEPLPEQKFQEWLAQLEAETKDFEKKVQKNLDDKNNANGNVNGGDKESQAIVDAKAKLAEVLQAIEAETAKKELEAKIKTIEHNKALKLEAIKELEDSDKSSIEEIANARIEAETTATNEIAKVRQDLVAKDIKALEAQEAILLDQAKNHSETEQERIAVAAEIKKVEGEILALKVQQAAIQTDADRRNVLFKMQELSAARKEAEDEAKRQRDKNAKAAAKALKDQERLERELHRAKLSLMVIEGKEAEARMLAIEDRYGKLLNKLEKGSEEAQLVEKLINASKAKVLMQDLEDQVGELYERLQRGEISTDEYDQGVKGIDSQLRDAASKTGNPEEIERVNRLLDESYNKISLMNKAGEIVGQSLSNNLYDSLLSIADGTKTASQAFKEMAASILADLGRMILKQLLFRAIQGAIGGGGGALAQGVMSGVSAGVYHSGGIIGALSGRTMNLDPSIFQFATRYHTGGIGGLAPDEVPAVLQKGEEVLTANDPRHRNNLGGGSTPMNVNIQNSLDNQSIASALEGGEGENMVINHIRANASEVRAVLS